MVIINSEYAPVPLAHQPLHETILQKAREIVNKTPNKKAFINAFDESDYITYEQVIQYTESVASFLHSRGFSKQRACVVLSNCWEYVTFFLGVECQGGAVSGASAVFTDYELGRQFSDSDCTVVLTGEDQLDKVLIAASKCPKIKTIIVIRNKGSTKALPANVFEWKFVMNTPRTTRPPVHIDMDDDIMILPYSSGTTGSPKGVMVTHRGFGTMVEIYRRHQQKHILEVFDPSWNWEREHMLLFLPFYHIFGFGVMASSLLFGCTSPILSHFEPDVFCRNIQKYKIRTVALVPPILVFLGKHPIPGKYDLSCLEMIMSGAAPAGKDICEEVQRRFPSVRYITQGYGMTELSLASHFPDLRKPLKFGSVGQLCANNQMKIVDPVTKRECDKGERGEICIKGPTVMKGYLHREEATRETIIDGWLHTGDIGYVDDDGELFIVDRLKELIKVKGFQVPPAELEDLLLSHPKIHDAAVIGIPDAAVGELPRAYVVRSDKSLTEQQVADFIKERVSHYKQLKGGVYFINEIPKSAAGKILRRMLRDKAVPAKL